MGDALREARWLKRGPGRWGSLFGSQRDEWIWRSSWMSTPSGVLELPLVSSIARDVPPCHRVRVERGRTHVLLRLLGQHI